MKVNFYGGKIEEYVSSLKNISIIWVVKRCILSLVKIRLYFWSIGSRKEGIRINKILGLFNESYKFFDKCRWNLEKKYEGGEIY